VEIGRPITIQSDKGEKWSLALEKAWIKSSSWQTSRMMKEVRMHQIVHRIERECDSRIYIYIYM